MAASWSSPPKTDIPPHPALAALRRTLGVLARLSPISRFVIADDSMLPSFAPRDRVIVSRLTYLRRRPRVGDVVVLRDPQDAQRRLLKRIISVAAGRYEVRGDNSLASRDSRTFGPVQRRSIIGKVWLKY